MNKYKVQITKTYVIDLQLSEVATQEDIIKVAEDILDAKMLSGTEHYNQTGDTDFLVFDVTNTDDPFNA